MDSSHQQSGTHHPVEISRREGEDSYTQVPASSTPLLIVGALLVIMIFGGLFPKSNETSRVKIKKD